MKGPQRRKILYAITKSAWGGAQRYVYDLSTRLPRDEFDAAVAFGGKGPLGVKLAAAGIRVIPIPSLERDIGVLREAASFFSLLRVMLREKPDIVHLSSSKAGGIGAVAARMASLVTRHRSLVVFTVHGWAFHEPRPAWQRMLIMAASWLSTRFQDAVILITALDRRAAERFVPQKKLISIAHGIPPIPFLSRIEARAALADLTGIPLPEDVFLVGTIAELTPNKGIRHLIEAVNQVKLKVKSIKFKVIAIGDGEEKKRLQARIAKLGLEDTVRFIGFIPDAGRYLTGLDLFVLPSLKEGLPYALMEAMAAGLPVAATNVGGIPDLIADGVNGRLVPPQNPEALGRAMAELFQNRALGRELGGRARETISRSFGIARMLERTIAVYQSR